MLTYYVYIQRSSATGEYYIGKGSCEGRPEDDSYIGSGKLFLRKYAAHPETFEKTIIQTFTTEEEALAAEAVLVGDKHKNGSGYDGLCLNLIAGGGGGPSGEALSSILRDLWSDDEYRAKLLSSRRSDEFRAQARAKAKRKIKMQRDGNIKPFAHDDILPALEAGWSIVAQKIWLHKHGYGVVNLTDSTYVIDLMRAGFVYGKNYALPRVSSPQAYADFGLEDKVASVRAAKVRASIEESKQIALSKDGDIIEVSEDDLEAHLTRGWRFKNGTISLYHDEHQVCVTAYFKTARNLVLNHGFRCGRKTAYTSVGIRALKEMLSMQGRPVVD